MKTVLKIAGIAFSIICILVWYFVSKIPLPKHLPLTPDLILTTAILESGERVLYIMLMVCLCIPYFLVRTAKSAHFYYIVFFWVGCAASLDIIMWTFMGQIFYISAIQLTIIWGNIIFTKEHLEQIG